ncbi:MAG: hypothetical protein FWG18_00790 [Alphaproteobacteria bacterium]|nr:hypothetical protein [Alphaproteobacteria bacterium]
MNIKNSLLRYVFKGPVVSITEPKFNERKVPAPKDFWEMLDSDKKPEPVSQPFYYVWVAYENAGVCRSVFYGDFAKNDANDFYNKALAKCLDTVSEIEMVKRFGKRKIEHMVVLTYMDGKEKPSWFTNPKKAKAFRDKHLAFQELQKTEKERLQQLSQSKRDKITT